VPELTQIVLTDDQALQVSQALSLAIENSFPEQLGGEEGEQALKQLSVFFGLVAANPERFPVSGRLAKALKTAKRSALKGPAQPQSRRNKRKARQEKRRSFHKRRRKEQAETVAAHNAAQEALERDLAEMEETYQEQMARLTELSEKNNLTVEELRELLSLSGAPPAIMAAVEKLDSKPRLIVPGA
jgi:hypothetical protein